MKDRCEIPDQQSVGNRSCHSVGNTSKTHAHWQEPKGVGGGMVLVRGGKDIVQTSVPQHVQTWWNCTENYDLFNFKIIARLWSPSPEIRTTTHGISLSQCAMVQLPPTLGNLWNISLHTFLLIALGDGRHLFFTGWVMGFSSRAGCWVMGDGWWKLFFLGWLTSWRWRDFMFVILLMLLMLLIFLILLILLILPILYLPSICSWPWCLCKASACSCFTSLSYALALGVSANLQSALRLLQSFFSCMFFAITFAPRFGSCLTCFCQTLLNTREATLPNSNTNTQQTVFTLPILPFSALYCFSLILVENPTGCLPLSLCHAWHMNKPHERTCDKIDITPSYE